MTRAGRSIVALAIAALLAGGGCAAAPPSAGDGPVRVFAPGERPPPYTEIARATVAIDGLDFTVLRPAARAERLAREAARRLGGDCIILLDVHTVRIARQMFGTARIIAPSYRYTWAIGRLEPPREPPLEPIAP